MENKCHIKVCACRWVKKDSGQAKGTWHIDNTELKTTTFHLEGSKEMMVCHIPERSLPVPRSPSVLQREPDTTLRMNRLPWHSPDF